MTLIRTHDRQRLTYGNRPPGCPIHSAGMFRMRADGTSRFDRHFHDFDEFWFVRTGTGTIRIGSVVHQVEPGDIVFTKSSTPHDITAVTGNGDLEIFWLSLPGPPGSRLGHLHLDQADADGHLVPALPAAVA